MGQAKFVSLTNPHVPLAVWTVLDVESVTGVWLGREVVHGVHRG